MKLNEFLLMEESESNRYVGGTCWTPILEEFKRVFPAKGRAPSVPNAAGKVLKFGTLFARICVHYRQVLSHESAKGDFFVAHAGSAIIHFLDGNMLLRRKGPQREL